MNMNVEKGDTVALRDGRTVVVLGVKPDYEHPGSIIRFDYVNPSERSPMRKTGYPSEILNILKKNPNKAPDPKAERPYDNKKPDPTEVVVLNGEEYIKKNKNGQTGAPPVTPAVAPQVHPAVTAPAKPVVKRMKGPQSAAK